MSLSENTEVAERFGGGGLSGDTMSASVAQRTSVFDSLTGLAGTLVDKDCRPF